MRLTILFLFIIQISLFGFSIDNNHAPDDDKIIINYKQQDVKFSKSKDGTITATLAVKEKLTSLTSLNTNVSRAVFYNEFSYVDYVRKNGKKYITANSDYEVNGIFHSDAKISVVSHMFRTDGESVEIQYKKVFKDFKFIDKLYMDDVYPVNSSTINIHVPEWLDLDKLEWNLEGLDLFKKEEKKKKSIIYTYNLESLDKRVKYSNQPSSAKVSPHLILVLQAIKNGSKVKKLMQSPDDLYKWYHEVTSEIGNDSDVLKTLVKELTASAQTDEDKVRNIYYWIQDNIRYLAFEAGMMGFKPEACQDVLSNKYGDCKGMANLTKEMLTLAGYDARLTWLGTNDLPYDYSIPSLVVDNHMICTVILDGKEVYLDATEKYADLYSNAYRIQGKEVMIQNGAEYYIETIPMSDLQESKEVQRLDLKIEDGQLVGNGIQEFSGERKVWLLNNLTRMNKKDRQEALQSYISNQDNNIQAQLSTELNDFPRDQDIKVEYDLNVDNKIIDLANELYVALELDFPFRKYQLEEREKPLDLSYSYYLDCKTNLTIPDGYMISYTPESVIFNDSKFDFDLSYELEGNVIVYTKKIIIKDPTILVSDFEKWNNVMDQLSTFYDDQIILKKQ